MRKSILLAVIAIALLVLGACGKSGKDASASDGNGDKEVTLKISASSVPHAEILEFIAPDLEKEGVKIEVVLTTDGIQANQQVADKELDANFFQHEPYLEQVNKDSGLDLVSVMGTHIEPFGVYSKKIKSINEVSDGAKVGIPKDPVNFSRALLLLASAGLIELDEEKTGDYLLQDITKNHKNLEFVAVESALLVRTLDDTEISTVNANYALEANYNPMKDALVIEGSSSPYVNILVSRPDNRDSEAIQKLAAALTTEKVKEFILEKYGGAVVPVF
jgi:D-methionine transport system substrate-binding protein